MAGKWEIAKVHLRRAIVLDSNFSEAKLQMGFILLWEDQIEEAKDIFTEVLDKDPCEKRTLYGLSLIAKKLGNAEALAIYQKIHLCNQKDVDTLLFLGQIYLKNHQLEEAKKAFLEVLCLAPDYEDAATGLFRIYILEKDSDAISKLYEKYSQNTNIQHSYANFLLSRQEYKQAKKIYEQMPEDHAHWKQLWEIKSHADPAVSVEATYTDAKENDPTLKKPVVKDYYFLGAVNVLVPIYDQWRLDTKGFVYHQRENDILLPVLGVNYNMFSSGGTLNSHYYFTPDWRWDIFARCFEAYGRGSMHYPFRSTTRFEPGTSLIFNKKVLFVLDAHIESFVTKNFAQKISELMRTDFLQGVLGYHPDIKFHPRVEAWSGWVHFHDSFHNWKNKQSVEAKFDLYSRSLTSSYLFEYAGFVHLNPNYYSYKRQFRNTVEFKYSQEVHSKLYFEMFWDHTWEKTYQFFMPIGNLLFVAPKLYLIWNTFTAQISYRHKDIWKIEMGGHYLHNTLPYHDWNIHGSMAWQF